MRRAIPLVLLLAGCLPGTAPTSRVTPEQAERLSSVEAVYVDDLGDANGAGLVRERIRSRLAASGRFEMAETAAVADAVLRGVAGTEIVTAEGQNYHRGLGSFRLENRATGQVLWTHEYRRGFSLDWRILDRIADQAVDQLLVDAGPRTARIDG